MWNGEGEGVGRDCPGRDLGRPCHTVTADIRSTASRFPGRRGRGRGRGAGRGIRCQHCLGEADDKRWPKLAQKEAERGRHKAGVIQSVQNGPESYVLHAVM